MAGSLLGYFFYLCAAFTTIMMVLTSLFNDSIALKTLGHYPRPIIMRTFAMRDGPLTTASVRRKVIWRKSNPSEATEVSSSKDMENTPVATTTKSKQRLKTLARQSDNSIERRYATAPSHAYVSSFADQFIAGAATAR